MNHEYKMFVGNYVSNFVEFFWKYKYFVDVYRLIYITERKVKCSLWYSKQRIFILYLFFVWLLVMKQFSVQNYFSWWLKIKTYCYTYPILIWIHHINYQKVYIKKRNIYFIKNYQEITMDSRTAVLKILLYHEIKKNYANMKVWIFCYFLCIFYINIA